MLTVQRVPMRSEFLTHECSAGQRCQADQRQLLCWILGQRWWRTSTHIQKDRRTIAGAFRSIVEENKMKIEGGVGQRCRYSCTAGGGKDSGGAEESGVGPTERHSRIDPSQGTTHFSPSVDGSCKFGGSSKVGVRQFSTTTAQCGSNFRTCIQWSGPSEHI